MSSLKREMLKKEWKAFRKENRQYKQIAFPQFRKLWEASLLSKEKEAKAAALTESQETELADMLEEVVEDESPEVK
jgi:hypothetical protein